MLSVALTGLLLHGRSPARLAPDPCGGPSRLLATLNRPTIGYSACAVAAHTVVFEEGYQFQRGGGQTLIQYPQSFVRYGIAPRLEVDLIGPEYNRAISSAGSPRDGLSDSGIGFKVELPPHGRWTLGLDGLYTTPNGSPQFTFGGTTLTANADVSYAVTPSVSLGTTQAFSAASGVEANGSAVRYGLWMPSVVLTKQLNGENQLYAEYVYQSATAPGAGGRAYVDYGLQHLIGPRLEVDAELGDAFSANPRLRFNYVGVGLGFQLGNGG